MSIAAAAVVIRRVDLAADAGMSRALALEVRRSCKSILRLGRRDGAKRVCLDHTNVSALPRADVAQHFSGSRPGAACLVYSFGCHNEWSFDLAANRHGLAAHQLAFECVRGDIVCSFI